MQKYRGLFNVLILLVLVVGAATASVFLEESAPGAAAVIRRITVIAGAGLVLTMWQTWQESRSRKKKAPVEVRDDTP